MAHSNVGRRARKPHKDFPLSPRSGENRWCKKVGRKMFYFAGTADEALAEWVRTKDYILAHGRKPPEGSPEGFTVEDLADHFLNAKRNLVVSGELTTRMYDEYFATCARLIKAFGKLMPVESLRPEDFDRYRAAAAAQWGPHRLSGEIQRVRTICKFGFDADHIDRPVKFGPAFKKPSAKVMRVHRAAKGHRMIEAAELRKLIDKAGVPLKAMILLAMNGGLGNGDCGMLPVSAVDLEGGWIRYPRPKTGIDRRFPLWPETIAAIKAAIAKRPAAKLEADAKLLFLTKYGAAWAKSVADNPVTKEFRKLLDELELHRPGLGFYSLRHVFETVAGESRDQVAVDHIMGHCREDMATVYRERISDERLKAVVDHVHAWLFPPEPEPEAKPARKKAAKKGGVK